MPEEHRNRRNVAPDLRQLLSRMSLTSQLVDPRAARSAASPKPRSFPAEQPPAGAPAAAPDQADSRRAPTLSEVAPQEEAVLPPVAEAEPEGLAAEMALMAGDLDLPVDEAGIATEAPPQPEPPPGTPIVAAFPGVPLERMAQALQTQAAAAPPAAAGQPVEALPSLIQPVPEAAATPSPAVPETEAQSSSLAAAFGSLLQTAADGPTAAEAPPGEAEADLPAPEPEPAVAETALEFVPADVAATLALSEPERRSVNVRMVALTPSRVFVAAPPSEALPSTGPARLAVTLPGAPKGMLIGAAILGRTDNTDDSGQARQLVQLGLQWANDADREALEAFYWSVQEARSDPMQAVAANVKIEVLEGPRAGAQFLGKSSYASRMAVQCTVENFDVAPETRVRFSLIAPRFVDQITLPDAFIAAMTPSGGRKMEVQVQFSAAHEDLLDFVTKYFSEKPAGGLPFLSRFRRSLGTS